MCERRGTQHIVSVERRSQAWGNDTEGARSAGARHQNFSIELDKVLNFDFEVDAAAEEDNALCERFFTDGLATTWSAHARRIYINPPYSDIPRWLQKAYEESQLGCTCVVLIPSHKGESWWDEWVVDHAERVILLKGRLRFVHPVSGQLESKPHSATILLSTLRVLRQRGIQF